MLEYIREQLLLEKNRKDLIDKSKKSDQYKDTSKGKNRWERRNHSRIAASVADYNKIDMNAFWKGDILEFGINVHGETDDYVVTVIFEHILDEIRQQIKMNNMKLEFKCILKALVKVFNSDDVYIHCTCLHPDTQIKLLDGTTCSVKEMCERYNNGEKLWVYSIDNNGDFKPGEVEKVWVTKKEKSLIKITLDNGKEITTTLDHPYMMRDGSYKLAQHLAIGESLMPLHKVAKIEYITLDKPIEVYDIKVAKWENFLVDAGVVLHNCPDFTYRQDYWATQGRYNAGLPQMSNGKGIANPNDTKGAGCKHVNLVLGNLDWLMKIASVINNYIYYCKDNMENNYAQYIFPKIYGMPYDKAVQLTFNDFDADGNLKTDLATSPDDINLANALGKRRTQYKPKGETSVNPRFNKKKEEPEEEDTLLKGNNPLGIKFADNKKELIPDVEEQEPEIDELPADTEIDAKSYDM